ncbi:DMT family transporter [Streptomyces zhihengii]
MAAPRGGDPARSHRHPLAARSARPPGALPRRRSRLHRRLHRAVPGAARGPALGVAYGIWGASGVALTAVLATFIFGDPLTALMGVGIALVIAGVLCVELGTQAAHARQNQDTQGAAS